MGVPVHTLNQEQKIWYARIVIAAILADEEISPSEVDFLKQVIKIVGDPEEKKALMQMVSTKTPPPLTAPQGIENEILAAIFVELILIMISDLDFAEKEKSFLKEISHLFNFTDAYYIELIKWGEEGVKWKNSQRYLVSSDGTIDEFGVPLDSLSSEQKSWYSKILIATIMQDGQVDDTELQFLKAAISIVDNKKVQQQLVGYVRNKMAPPLVPPPEIPNEILLLIFLEVILIVSADENLSITEKTHLKHLADLCGFSDDQLSKTVDWCHQGISWKQNKNPLIARCKFNAKLSAAHGNGPLEQNADNNSLLNREFGCHICDSRIKVKGFQLKPHSHEPNRNIFGITAYLESLGDYDYVDYNLIKVYTCPNCLFSSPEKSLFKKRDDDPPPKALENPAFKSFWLKDIKQKRAAFQDCLPELSSISRSLATVVKSYRLAINAAKALGKTNKDQDYNWQAVTLLMTLAEILMNHGAAQKAEECLEQARIEADDLFKNASSHALAIKSARLLFFIALYHNDVRVASPLLDYIRNLYKTKGDSLSGADLSILKKVYGETKDALSNRAHYKKDELVGFHMNI